MYQLVKVMTSKSFSNNFRSVSVLDLATRDVITIPPATTIIETLKCMLKHHFRRIPIADEGTKTIKGIITATDLVSFLGGGPKYKIVEEMCSGNLSAALNSRVGYVMEEEVIMVDSSDSWDHTLDLMLDRGIGGCPVVDKEGRVVGIVTERDILNFLAGHIALKGYAMDYMNKNVITCKFNESVGEVMKLMLKKFRRLPIIKGETLVGLITVREILRYFGTGDVFKSLLTGNIKEALGEPVSNILRESNLFVYLQLPYKKDIPLVCKHPLTCSPYTNMTEITKAIVESNYEEALIVEKEKLEGMISEQDLVRSLYSAA